MFIAPRPLRSISSFRSEMSASLSLNELENIFLFKRNFELLQPCQVFIFECPSMMMLFLVPNVTNDCAQLGMSIGKRAIAFLPTESSANPLLLVDEVRGV